MLVAGSSVPATAQTTRPRTPADQIVDADNSFGFDLYQKLVAEPEASGKNLFFSPYSICTAFSMLLEGAHGDTARQLSAALHLPATKESDGITDLAMLHDGALSIRKRFAESTADKGFQLFAANGIWIDQSFSPSAAFTKSLDAIYGVQTPSVVNFRNDSQAARQLINAWGDRQTRGKIKEILPIEPSSASAMVLANTVYLKATWFKPFDRKNTAPKSFHVDRDPAHDVSVAMMSEWTDDKNSYMENDDFQMTLLSYGYLKDQGQTMAAVLPAYILLVLPKRIDGLADVEKSLTWQKLDQCRAGFGEAMVQIELPRFKMTGELDLKRMVSLLGARDVFDPQRADLSGIAPASSAGPLYVSAATHHAVIDVDEEGTEASASSTLIASGGGAAKRANMRADHPFLFYIIHRETDAILFMGRVMKPTE
jgi:serpin B